MGVLFLKHRYYISWKIKDKIIIKYFIQWEYNCWSHLTGEHDEGSSKPVVVKNLHMEMKEPVVVFFRDKLMFPFRHILVKCNPTGAAFIFAFAFAFYNFVSAKRPRPLGTWTSSWIPQEVPAVALQNSFTSLLSKTMQELRMLSPSHCIQRSQCNCSYCC